MTELDLDHYAGYIAKDQSVYFAVDVNNFLHKPPRGGGMRIEKVLQLPGDHSTLF